MRKRKSSSQAYLFKSKNDSQVVEGGSIFNKNKARIDELRKANFSIHEDFGFDDRSKKVLKPKETLIFNLQEKAILTAQKLQIQLQKEKYYEKEIEDLKQNIEDKRELEKETSKNPQNLQKVLTIIKKKIDKKVFKVNTTKAFNIQLRKEINKKRKERTIYDSIYTKLEKDILVKERLLLDLLANEEEKNTELREKIEDYQNKKNQSSKEQGKFEVNYDQIISKINETEYFEENSLENENHADVNDYPGEEILNTERSNPSNKTKSRQAVMQEELIRNKKRAEELKELKGRFKTLELLTQEKDLVYVKDMYFNGEKINEELFGEIKMVEKELREEREELTNIRDEIEEENKDLDPEGKEIMQLLNVNSKKLSEFSRESSRMVSEAEIRKREEANLKFLIESVLGKLDLAEDDEVEAVENIGRSNNHRLRTIEEIISEARIINKYHEIKNMEASEIKDPATLRSKEESRLSALKKTGRKKKEKKNEDEKFSDITDINTLIGNESNRDRENLIVEELFQVRSQILKKVENKMGLKNSIGMRRGKVRKLTKLAR